MSRIGFLALGWTALALGFIGVVLPGLPTTVFMIVAAFAFGKASPRLRIWLIEHRIFGQTILDWEERGAISRKGKIWSSVTMAAVIVISLILHVPGWVLALQVVCLGAVSAFILTRPE